MSHSSSPLPSPSTAFVLLSATLDDALPKAWEDRIFNLLPKEQSAMISRNMVERDRQLRLLVRFLLALGLWHVEGIGLHNALQLINKDDKGRPTITHGLWECSFSHSHRLAVCLLGQRKRTGKVGVDVEKIRPLSLEEVACAFCTEEKTFIVSSKDKLTATLFDIWTKKEAVLKTFGTGFLHEPNTVNTLASLPLPAMPRLASANISLEQGSGYAAAAAVEFGPLPEVTHITPFAQQESSFLRVALDQLGLSI